MPKREPRPVTALIGLTSSVSSRYGEHERITKAASPDLVLQSLVMSQVERLPERAWTDPAAWLPADVPVTVLRWRARWLASPAAVFLLSATAIVLAAAWLIAAAVVVATIVSGHAIAAAVGAAHATGPALSAVDVVAGAGALALLGRRPSQPGRPRRRGRVLPFLPRQVSWTLVCASVGSLVVFTWLTLQAISGPGTSASGQQFAAAAWMVHLSFWCLLTCKQLNRSVSSAPVTGRGLQYGSGG